VLGAPLLGRYEGVKAGHAINNLLVRELLANPQAGAKSPASRNWPRSADRLARARRGGLR
jgi:UDP-3-O-acyl-N-acetylglucosamine deacetylase